MKSSILPKRNDRLQAELESLYTLKPNELAERWRALYGADLLRISRTPGAAANIATTARQPLHRRRSS